jgi:hypothetical protein
VVDLSTIDFGVPAGFYGPTPAPTRAAAFGVSKTAKTRAYYAGIVVAQNGHANGITPANGGHG